jgi:GNAT superfamily N-acetyltransferase
VTVLPEHQGKGIGKALFSEVTRKADAEGVKCYLESSRDKPNTLIYEAMGFRMVKKMECVDEGEVCDLYCMVREPKTAA